METESETDNAFQFMLKCVKNIISYWLLFTPKELWDVSAAEAVLKDLLTSPEIREDDLIHTIYSYLWCSE